MHLRGNCLPSLAVAFAVVSACCLVAAEPPTGTPSALRVGVAPTSPPMIFKEGKTIAGIDADLARLLGRALGRPVQFVEFPFAELLDALEADKIDIIMSSMSVTRARQTRVAFSEPYMRVGQMALVRSEDKFLYSAMASVIANQTIGVKKGTTADLLVQQEFPRAKRKYFKTGDEAARAVQKGKINAYFSDSTMIWYLSGKFEAEGLVAAPTLFSDERLAWAVRRSDTALLEAANKALQEMNANGELKQVFKRWIPKFE